MKLSDSLLNLNFLTISLIIAISVVFLIAVSIPVIKYIINKKKKNKEKQKEAEAKKAAEDKVKKAADDEAAKKNKYFEDMYKKLEDLEPLDAKKAVEKTDDDVILDPFATDKNLFKDAKASTLPDEKQSGKVITDDLDLELDDEILKFLESEEDEGFYDLIKPKSFSDNIYSSKEKETGEVYDHLLEHVDEKEERLKEVSIDDELEDLYREEISELDKQHELDDEEFAQLHKDLIKKRKGRMQFLGFDDRNKIEKLSEELENSSKRMQAIVFMDILNKKKF